jgi:starch synthase
MLKVLHVSAECSPFVKIGGLADVVGSLPGEIKRLRGSELRVILPYYKSIPNKYKSKTENLLSFTIDFGFKDVEVIIKSLRKGNILYYFIDNDFYFGSRDNVYNYGDESKRFAFFQIAVLESLKHLDFMPDIIHIHDWHTAMIPLLLKNKYRNYNIKTVLSIHNLAYQGIYPLQDYNLFNIEYDSKFEFEGHLNFLKSGILCADLITTVSPNYANEILTDYYGYGMQNLLKQRGSDVIGILNGIDYNEFSPGKDKLIALKYNDETYIPGKLANKKDLFNELKVDFDLNRPVIALISRLVNQKGIDLIRRVFAEMLDMDDFTFIVLGSGEDVYEEYFRNLEKKYSDKVKVFIGYSNKLAHKIYAGADMFLMPSKFEPCGLGQIISLKYGTIPIVRETGGLVDTIEAFNEFEKVGNGFSFTNFNAHDMMHVIRYALHIYYYDKPAWNRIVLNAMNCDFSWNQSAKEYKKVYKELT